MRIIQLDDMTRPGGTRGRNRPLLLGYGHVPQVGVDALDGDIEASRDASPVQAKKPRAEVPELVVAAGRLVEWDLLGIPGRECAQTCGGVAILPPVGGTDVSSQVPRRLV